jgi:hypothetical protein
MRSPNSDEFFRPFLECNFHAEDAVLKPGLGLYIMARPYPRQENNIDHQPGLLFLKRHTQ